MKRTSMLWQVLIAIGLAIGAGALSGTHATLWGITYYRLYDLFGQLFLNALTLLVVPLVASAILHGLSQMRGDASFGRLGVKTFLFYVSTTFFAILVGIFFVNVIQPGVYHQNTWDVDMLAKNMGTATFVQHTQVNHGEALAEVLLKMIPQNIVSAAAQGNMLGIIGFSILFGWAMGRLEGSVGQTVIHFWKGVFHALMKMTQYVMYAMPFGVFCLMAKVVASKGLGSIASLGYFFAAVLFGFFVFAGIVLPIILKILGVNPIRHFQSLAPALVTAFSTSSSAATLPITMECVEKRAGVSNRVCSFVLPLGTSMNMSGSALYECMAALFIAQYYDIHFTVVHQIVLVVLALITSMGVAGVPSGSLVAIMIILNSMGLPPEGIALILPIDRIVDMFRTTVNVFSDASCAVLVARSEKEQLLTAEGRQRKTP